jgi:hypothetical protein
VSDDDWKQEWRDAVGGLLLQLAVASEISAEDAQRDTCKALSEFVLIAIDLGGPGPFPPEEKMRREAQPPLGGCGAARLSRGSQLQ